MTADISELDAHEQPSDELRASWKAYAKTDHKLMQDHPDIDDPRSDAQRDQFVTTGTIPAARLAEALGHVHHEPLDPSTILDVPILYHPLLPGLLIVPDVIPPAVQKSLLSLMIHRDLSVPHHQTNMHLHYNLPYREAHEKDHSFFSYDPDSGDVFVPKDPSVHKPLTMDRVMNKRLHWVTLGGQYDWTNRVYPGEAPPAFPPDLAAFLEGLFPETLAQAAIVNFYTPGDTMMMHRDVSEETDRGLVSISLGCEGLFMITPRDPGKAGEQQDPAEGEMGGTKKPYLLLKLRSGDAVYMTGEARFAWHGVPKVLKGTCPSWLEDWPAEDGKYEAWRGWMRNKRVNLNVRQMRE
ncbi:oxidoreductase [Plectosphaerella cucumerina]|uniref:mRNA N(6)-methyladenine demethylase n=1 Tax=Plectosphaerella cucumerina TaxID=40658 RepID=A0A8K0THV1_9PEZI|nr:oxidoreductase [Plectosphaerella cucumerina]